MKKQQMTITIEDIDLELILTNSKGDTFTIPDQSRFEELKDFFYRAMEGTAINIISECTHENTAFKHLRCDVCEDCGEVIEIDV